MAILIVKLSALGDVVQTLPSLSFVKEHLPSERIVWVVEDVYKDLLVDNPCVDKIIAPPKGFLKSPKKVLKLFNELKQEKFRLIIDYQGLFKSGIICGIAKGDYKVGFANHREGSAFFYTHKLPPYDTELHAVLRYLNLTNLAIRFLGVDTPKNFSDFQDIPRKGTLPDEPVVGLSTPYFVLIPSARWETKEWFAESWGLLIEKLLLRFPSHSIYLVGKGSFRPWAEDMAKKYSRVYSLYDRLNLRELVFVLKNSSTVITVDTGPMHIASVLDKPIVALFGPTAPNRTGPWSSIFKIVKVDLPCSPCFKKYCNDRSCMKNIDPEVVLKIVEELQEMI